MTLRARQTRILPYSALEPEVHADPKLTRFVSEKALAWKVPPMLAKAISSAYGRSKELVSSGEKKKLLCCFERKNFAMSSPLAERDACRHDFTDLVIDNFRSAVLFGQWLSEAVGLR